MIFKNRNSNEEKTFQRTLSLTNTFVHMHQASLLTMCFCDGHPNTRLFGNHTPCRSIKDKPKFSFHQLTTADPNMLTDYE
jgi:hypothetical protein